MTEVSRWVVHNKGGPSWLSLAWAGALVTRLGCPLRTTGPSGVCLVHVWWSLSACLVFSWARPGRYVARRVVDRTTETRASTLFGAVSGHD